MPRRPVELGGAASTTVSVPRGLYERIKDHGRGGEPLWMAVERGLDILDLLDASYLKYKPDCPKCGEKLQPREVLGHFRTRHAPPKVQAA